MSREPQNPQMSPPWGSHPLPGPGDTSVVRIGPLTLWLQRHADEVWVAHRAGRWEDREDPEASPEETPGETEWIRWPVPEETREIVLAPTFPDRAVVVQPELSFRLIKGAQARIYIRVPLWAKVQLPGGEPLTLLDIPTMILSDTWWGGLSEGELCYWLETQARRQVGPGDFEPHLAVCPLQLSNRSGDDLNVEKLALRVTHLSVFHHEGRLLGDETRVRYRGDADGSEIEMTGKAPEEAAGAVRVTKPRESVSKGFKARTFAALRAIPGLGGSF